MTKKFISYLALSLIILALPTISRAVWDKPQMPPFSEAYLDYLDHPQDYGYIPFPFYVKLEFEPAEPLLANYSYDNTWRSAVKDQNPCNSCWIFASVASVESAVKHYDGVEPDYSESNILMCNADHNNCALGGYMSVALNHMITDGLATEVCQPWSTRDYCHVCPVPYRVNSYQFLGYGMTQATLKSVLQNGYGPVSVGMKADGLGGVGNHTCVNTDSNSGAHAIQCVGFNDASCSGNGAWEFKNSWGTAWGNSGYMYLQYGLRDVTDDNASSEGWRVTSYEDPLTDEEHLFYNDELGFTGMWGYNNGNAWGATKFVNNWNACKLITVEFNTVYNNTTYTINIYDNYNGSTFVNQLGSVTGNASYAGYHQVDLSTQVNLAYGNDFWLVCHYSSPSGQYPVPVTYLDPGAPNSQNYLSYTGNAGSWTTLEDDICLRAIASTYQPPYQAPLSSKQILLAASILIALTLLIFYRKKLAF